MLKFWSNITLLLQIVIVIAAVLLLAYFDPFGLFGSKKQKLENTPVSVKSIREIGQLISAEYYGEVLTSLQEAFIEDIKESAVTDQKEFESLRQQYEESIRDFYEKKNNVRLGWISRKNRLYDIFYQEYSLLTEHPFYQVFIDVTLADLKNDRGKQRYKTEKALLNAIYKMNPDKLDKLIEEINEIEITKYVNENQSQSDIFTADKKRRKRQIVVLGRGSVKAGINFRQFTESNFRFDRDKKIIHLIGMKPQILTSDINPWFIPEKKVKGFEIILMTRKASKPEYMLKVKERALKKLRQKAIQANIVKHAKVNAERNLLSFFSLLVPEGVEQVIIHDDYLSYFDKTFLTDSITTDIMRSVDSLMIRRYPSDSIEVMQLQKELTKRRIYLSTGDTTTINRYSSRLAMVEDEILSAGEMQWLNAERNLIMRSRDSLRDTSVFLSNVRFLPERLDSIWFYPTKAEIKSYKTEIEKTLGKEFKWHEVISKSDRYKENEKLKAEALRRKIYEKMMTERLFDLEELSEVLMDVTKNVVKDNVTYVKDNSKTSAEVVTLEDEDHRIIYTPTLDEHFDAIGGSIDELIEMDSALIDLDGLDAANKKVVLHWEHDREAAEKLLLHMNEDWRLLMKNDTLPIDRYSELYRYVAVDSLANTFFKRLNDEYQLINRADQMLSKNLKDLSLTSVRTANGTLDIAWFYPAKEEIEQFTKNAEERGYGLVSRKTKEKRKLIFTELQIQQHVLEKRKALLKRRVSELQQYGLGTPAS